MKTLEEKIFVNEKLGSVSCEVVEPSNITCVMTLAHGAGAGYNHQFMRKLSLALAEEGIGTNRFNLHYMEQRKKRPDSPDIAHEVIDAAITYTAQRYPSLPLICAGKSFGGRMTSQLLSKRNDSNVRAIVFFGFPLHPAGKPGIERSAHLSSIKVPILFLQGTRDALAEVSLVEQVTASLPLASTSWIEGADHSFNVGKKDTIDVLSKKTKMWLLEKHITTDSAL